MSNYSESELIIPALQIIRTSPGISTSDLIDQLENILAPDGEDLELNPSRSDSKFSQKVRNLVSHHTIDQQGLGYVKSEYQGRNWFDTITAKGQEYLDSQITDSQKTGVDVGLPTENQPSTAPNEYDLIDVVVPIVLVGCVWFVGEVFIPFVRKHLP